MTVLIRTATAQENVTVNEHLILLLFVSGGLNGKRDMFNKMLIHNSVVTWTAATEQTKCDLQTHIVSISCTCHDNKVLALRYKLKESDEARKHEQLYEQAECTE